AVTLPFEKRVDPVEQQNNEQQEPRKNETPVVLGESLRVELAHALVVLLDSLLDLLSGQRGRRLVGRRAAVVGVVGVVGVGGAHGVGSSGLPWGFRTVVWLIFLMLPGTGVYDCSGRRWAAGI